MPMAKQFHVVDCRTTLNSLAEVGVLASTPEHAARLVMGEDLVRGGRQSGAVRARVYSGVTGSLTMVRLYARSGASALPGDNKAKVAQTVQEPLGQSSQA
jgi:hypothetical protein